MHLSGNRNFEGRISPWIKRQLPGVSPPLVVAYALAGTTDIDLDHPTRLGSDNEGNDVFLSRYLAEPSRRATRTIAADCDVKPDHVHRAQYAVVQSMVRRNGERSISGAEGDVFANGTNRSRPTFAGTAVFRRGRCMPSRTHHRSPTIERRPGALVNAQRFSVTTDHISPAGSRSRSDGTGRSKYLQENGVFASRTSTATAAAAAITRS